jgi:glycosyltransferase involved in cell wall biosynthesis
MTRPRSGGACRSRHAAMIAWERHRRSQSLAGELGIPLHSFLSEQSRPFRYPVLLARTLGLLVRERPGVLLVQNPSLLLALVTLMARPLAHYRLVVDAHNAAIRPRGILKRFGFFYRCVQRHADLTIVTNDSLAKVVEENGGRTMVLPDAIPRLGQVNAKVSGHGRKVTFVCTFGPDEPWREAIAAADLLPNDIIIQVTGNARGRATNGSPQLGAKVRLTGFLPDEEYIRLLAESDVVMDLTLNEDCLVCGAYEAVALGVPLVLSDTAALRTHFHRGAVYARNDPEGIAAAIQGALLRNDELRAEIATLRDELEVGWRSHFNTLLEYIKNT